MMTGSRLWIVIVDIGIVRNGSPLNLHWGRVTNVYA